MKDKIRQLAASLFPRIRDLRRHLHQHPELSYAEVQTAAHIREQLRLAGIEARPIGGTGLVALIQGRNPGSRVVALRADIDALPIEEANEVPYRSVNPGVMHACGHDAHTACLFGAALILKELQDAWEGTVKLIFQPGEERNPGGASILIREGVLNDPEPEAIFGLHVHPGLPVGRFSFRAGKVMASADEIFITVKGRGGHAATPHLTTDTVLAAAQIVVSLQQLISRRNDPFLPSVLSICSVQGGHTTNVIPGEVRMMGTFRAMDEDWRKKAHQLIREVVESTARAAGVEVDLHIDVGYPSVYNHEALTLEAERLAGELVGPEQVETTELRMGAEDFGYYTQKIPGCFFRLGVGNKEKGIGASVHTPVFNIDEQALEYGAAMMAWMGAKARLPRQ